MKDVIIFLADHSGRMAWLTPTIRLCANGCPAAASLPRGQVMDCLHPGAQDEATGHFDVDAPTGWSSMAETDAGVLARSSASSCRACPVKAVDPGAVPLRAAVSRGRVEVDLAVPSRDALVASVNALRAHGSDVHVVRVGTPHAAGAHRVTIDLNHLTARQRQALRVATASGLFVPGGRVTLDQVAATMHISRSTLHEHIRRGLSTLLREALGPLPALDLPDASHKPRAVPRTPP